MRHIFVFDYAIYAAWPDVPADRRHWPAGWARGRSAMVQAAAINELMTKAMDDPKLAAELLREHNRYDAQVMGRRLLRKWGLRVP